MIWLTKSIHELLHDRKKTLTYAKLKKENELKQIKKQKQTRQYQNLNIDIARRGEVSFPD